MRFKTDYLEEDRELVPYQTNAVPSLPKTH